MKKLILVIALAAGLSGCANLSLLFQNYNNPIDKQTLYNVENTMIVAFAALSAYKKSCDQGVIAQVCKNNIVRIRVYTQRLPTLMNQLRAFVKQNDQVNARIVYTSITQLVSQLQADAAAAALAGGK